MSFIRVPASPALRPYISCYKISETHIEGSYKVIPGTSIVMGIQYKGGIAIEEKGKDRRLKPSGITGLNDTYRIFKNDAQTGTILIEFKPHGAARFFEFPMNLIFRNSLSLEELTSRQLSSELEERIACAENNDERINLLEHFFLSRLETGKTDTLVEEAVKRIHHFNGNIRMTALAASLCISQRQFEKRFLRVVGSSPKKFSSLVRFNNIVKHKVDFKTLTELSLDAGYFDQAHFIKDFKSYMGLTPEQFFADPSLDKTFR